MLVDEHRQQAGEHGCIDVVEKTDSEAFGDQQVALVEHTGEHRPLGGQRPAVGGFIEVAAVLEHADDTVELATE